MRRILFSSNPRPTVSGQPRFQTRKVAFRTSWHAQKSRFHIRIFAQNDTFLPCDLHIYNIFIFIKCAENFHVAFTPESCYNNINRCGTVLENKLGLYGSADLAGL